MKELLELKKPAVIQKIIEFIDENRVDKSYINTNIICASDESWIKLLASGKFRQLTDQANLLVGHPLKDRFELGAILEEVIDLRQELNEQLLIFTKTNSPILFLREVQLARPYRDAPKSVCVKRVETFEQTKEALLILNIQFAIKQYDNESKGELCKNKDWQFFIKRVMSPNAKIEESGLPLEAFLSFKRKVEHLLPNLIAKGTGKKREFAREYIIAVDTFNPRLTAEEILNQIIAIELETDSASRLLNQKFAPS